MRKAELWTAGVAAATAMMLGSCAHVSINPVYETSGQTPGGRERIADGVMDETLLGEWRTEDTRFVVVRDEANPAYLVLATPLVEKSGEDGPGWMTPRELQVVLVPVGDREYVDVSLSAAEQHALMHDYYFLAVPTHVPGRLYREDGGLRLVFAPTELPVVTSEEEQEPPAAVTRGGVPIFVAPTARIREYLETVTEEEWSRGLDLRLRRAE